jgi:hypothetical protein
MTSILVIRTERVNLRSLSIVYTKANLYEEKSMIFYVLSLVHGVFNEWSNYTVCNVTCGGGEQSRSRTCNHTTPMHGGDECLLMDNKTRALNETDSRNCSMHPCPSKILF